MQTILNISIYFQRCWIYVDRDSVTVFGNNTDLILMMMHFWKEGMGKLSIRSEYKKKGGIQQKQLLIENALAKLHKSVIPYLPVIDTFGGCNTKSAIYDKGNAAFLHQVENSKKARHLCDVFLNPLISQKEISDAGTRLFVLLYKGKETDKLADLRYNMYRKMAASASKIDPSKLPPTESTTKYHSQRVYIQIWQWNSFANTELSPLEWGCKMNKGRMTPVMTDQVNIFCYLFLTAILLHIMISQRICRYAICQEVQIRYKYDTFIFSYTGNCISCVAVCSDCRGIDCLNISKYSEEEEDIDMNDFDIDGNIFDRLVDF